MLLGIFQGRLPGRTGVWLGEKKLGAVGVAISGGYSRHGIALNVTTDLTAFNRIVPCGDPVRQATSLEKELKGKGPKLSEAAEVLARVAAQRLGFQGGVTWLPNVNELVAEIGVEP